MKNKTHFIFDLDDTLVDSHAFNQQMFVDTFIGILNLGDDGVDIFLRDLHRREKGTSMLSQFQQVIDKYELNTKASDLVARNETLHIENIHSVELFDGATDFIEYLGNKNINLSICSNRQTQSLYKVLQQHGITDLFSNIISCTDQGMEKPDPQCMDLMIDTVGISKPECIYFGDSSTDRQFAEAAGLDFFIVDQSIHNKKYFQTLLSLLKV